tara:strand:- start:1380 stop:2243 length:864 start_codon:yes stop_codon:yes gene_type:complete
VLLIVFLIPVLALSNSISISAELDTTEGFIGDLILWKVKVKGKRDSKYIFPEIKNDNSNINIEKINSIIDEQTGEEIGIEFQIVAWDTGQYSTPNYSIEIQNKLIDTSYSLEVEPIDFSIFSIVDRMNNPDFQDIKGPIHVNPIFPTKTIIYLIILITIIFFLIAIWKKRKISKHMKIDYSFTEDPKDRAIRRLRNLDDSKLSKEYYFLLSHIIREYIEFKFFIRTLEMTTQEIVNSREIFPFNHDIFLDLIQFFHEADEVKYARKIYNSEKMQSDKNRIETFIDIL